MTNMHREAFERAHGISMDEIERLPISSGARLSLSNAYIHDLGIWSAAIRHMTEQNKQRDSHE